VQTLKTVGRKVFRAASGLGLFDSMYADLLGG
jgi:hypothetical protein